MKNHRILIGITAVITLWLSYTLPMQVVEQSALDWVSRFIPPKKLESRVVVIAIDQKSIDAISPWPWSYQIIARLLDRLNTAGLKSIGLLAPPLSHSENYFQKITGDTSENAGLQEYKKNLQLLDYDRRLEQVLKKNNNVVLPIVYSSDQIVSPTGRQNELSELLQEGKLIPLAADNGPGTPWFSKLPWIFKLPEHDYVIANMPQSRFSAQAQGLGLLPASQSWTLSQPFAVKIGENYFPSFIAQMASRIMNYPATLVAGYGVNIDGVITPTDPAYRFLPSPSVGKTGGLNVLTISALDVLNGSAARKLPKSVKAAVIGLTVRPAGSAGQFTAYGDIEATPVLWLAHSLNSLLNESLIQHPYWSFSVQRLAILLLAVYLIMLPAKLRSWLGFAVTTLLSVLIINSAVLMLLVMNFYQPLIIPAIFTVFGHLLLTIHYKITHAFKSARMEAANAYRELSLNLQAQGRLDQAFNYMRKCEMDTKLIECLYNLGLEFERRRQFNQAVAVYDYIAEKDSDYRDIQQRRIRHQTESNRNMLTGSLNSYASTLVVDHPSVARPVLGRYQVEKVIGQGAMGTVYLGIDPKISRTVAIKALPLSDEFDSKQIEEVRKRFYREAETAGRLNHPNIVTIFDVGEEHDLAYIAMDYISGEGLDAFGHPDNLLPIDEVFHIGITVADALEYAHQQNVVHRDIKPANILYDRETGNLKLTDFGIACLTDNSRTRTGTVLGSPSYMSPEQLAGEQVDGRSDIYSLGITLYQLFTGVLPFNADSMASLAYKIANNKAQGIRKIRPELPTCLTRVINKSMEKNPQLRYQNGSAFADALRRCSKR